MKNKEVVEELIKEMTTHSSKLSWIMRSSKNIPENNIIDAFLIHRQVEIDNLISLLREKRVITHKTYKKFIKELEDKELFK